MKKEIYTYVFDVIIASKLFCNAVPFVFPEYTADWSDHCLYWPDKRLWLTRTKSTLDQYGVQADVRLWFTPMHKALQVTLPDLQTIEMQINFSINVFGVVIKICKELGTVLLIYLRLVLSLSD